MAAKAQIQLLAGLDVDHAIPGNISRQVVIVFTRLQGKITLTIPGPVPLYTVAGMVAVCAGRTAAGSVGVRCVDLEGGRHCHIAGRHGEPAVIRYGDSVAGGICHNVTNQFETRSRRVGQSDSRTPFHAGISRHGHSTIFCTSGGDVVLEFAERGSNRHITDGHGEGIGGVVRLRNSHRTIVDLQRIKLVCGCRINGQGNCLSCSTSGR